VKVKGEHDTRDDPMREPIELIEYRLLKLGLPPEFVAQHLKGVARWRTELIGPHRVVQVEC
jgi:hypothetical protein